MSDYYEEPSDYDSSEDSYAEDSYAKDSYVEDSNVEDSNPIPVPLEMEYSQFAQITTHFPISWRNNYNLGTGGFDINLSQDKIELVFGDSIWYITKSDDLTIGMVFDQIFNSTFLAGKSYRLELDAWCAMNTDDFFALPLNEAFLCQGQLYLN